MKGLPKRIFNVIDVNSIPKKIATITEVLKENGYGTYGVANNPNICQKEGFTQGFDKFKLFKMGKEKKLNLRLKGWYQQIKSEKKYFLYIHYNDCHAPYHRRQPWYKKGDNERADRIARYDSEINYVDTKIEEMYKLFDWDRNTLLIVTSDHGEEFFEHGNWRHGWTLYSEVIHVPLIIQFPEKDRVHKRIKINVSNMDILPSVRSYLGLKGQDYHAGKNLMPLIQEEENNLHERYIFSHLLRRQMHQNQDKVHKCTIFKEWKYIFTIGSDKNIRRELYNFKRNPSEKINLFEKHKKIAHSLSTKFINFEKRCQKYKQKSEKVKLNKEKIKELKSLGYIR
jgi:arylsulfatase A-like enzyme